MVVELEPFRRQDVIAIGDQRHIRSTIGERTHATRWCVIEWYAANRTVLVSDVGAFIEQQWVNAVAGVADDQVIMRAQLLPVVRNTAITDDVVDDELVFTRGKGAGKLVEDEELREAMSEKGLGTPATRASVMIWPRLLPASQARSTWRCGVVAMANSCRPRGRSVMRSRA